MPFLPRSVLALLSACALFSSASAPKAQAQAWSPVPPADFNAISLTQFADHELDLNEEPSLPYFLYHFHTVANAVVETTVPGVTERGFLNLKVNRSVADNTLINARIQEMQMALAYFYCTNRPWNPYYGHPAVRVRLEAMLTRWNSLQNQPGSADGDFDGLFREYNASNWSISPTSFGSMAAAQALDLIITSGVPFDATLLEANRVTLRNALIALFTRADVKVTARNYSNQMSGSFYAALIYLKHWPDAAVDSGLVAMVNHTVASDQSPAGYHYENTLGDFGYSGVHDNNLRYALPLARQRADILTPLLTADDKWNRWLGANYVPVSGAAISAHLANSAINTRTPTGIFFPKHRPLGEWLDSARAFALTDTEYAAALVDLRATAASFWNSYLVPAEQTATTADDLPQNGYSYHPGFVYDAVRPLNTWHPNADQRLAARRLFAPATPTTSNIQRRDAYPAVSTYLRRPDYYAVFNSEKVKLTDSGARHQNLGLTVLWNPLFGPALHATHGTTHRWGTVRTGQTVPYEQFDTYATRTANGTAVTTANGISTLPLGNFVATYPLASGGTTYGSKTVRFFNDRIEVALTHTGAFTELLPLVRADDAVLTSTANSLTLTRPNGASLVLQITAGTATITPGTVVTLDNATSLAGYGNSSDLAGTRRLPVTIAGTTALTYTLTARSGPTPLTAIPDDTALLTGTSGSFDVLANDVSLAGGTLTLTSVGVAPTPAPVPAVAEGNVLVSPLTSAVFPTNFAVTAAGASAPATLQALPGFSVQTNFLDTQPTPKPFLNKGTTNSGITNYIAHSALGTALRFRLETNSVGSNTSAGGLTTNADLCGSAGNAAYLGAVGGGWAHFALTFGRYTGAATSPATLGFTTQAASTQPLAVRATGFLVTGVAASRTVTADFLGLGGQLLARQSATGTAATNGGRLYFAYDAGTNPSGWVTSVVIRANNNNANLGFDDLGFTPITAVNVGTPSLSANRVAYTPPAGFTGVVRFNYTVSNGTHASTGVVSTEVMPLPALPVINSPLTLTGTYRSALPRYAVTATGNPTSYGALGLPAGLSLDSPSGRLTGTPTQAGIFNVTLQATNAGGTGSATLVLTIPKPGLAVSGLAASAKIYDRTTSVPVSGTATLVGTVLAGDSVTLGGAAVGNFVTSSVGTAKPVTVSGLTLTGVSAANYTLTLPSLSADIIARPLSVVDLWVYPKLADGSVSALLNSSAALLSGVISGDNVTLDLASAVATFASATPGLDKPVSVSGLALAGVSVSNYTLTAPTVVGDIVADLSAGYAHSMDVLAAEPATPPLTLTAIDFAPPEAAAAQPHGRAVIQAASATVFPTTQVFATGATSAATLTGLPGFLVLTNWQDTQNPVNAFAAKGGANGVTNYQLRSDAAKTALRFQFNSNTTSNTSAGGVTTSATLLGSAGNAAYVGAYGGAYGNVAITFGRHAVATQDAATLGFSTTSPTGRPLAVRASGLVLTGVNNARTFTVQFRGLYGQLLSTQTATGNNPAAPVRLYFGHDAGANPANWITSIVIDGDNGSANIGLDDVGFTPVTAVDVGTAVLFANQVLYTPAATFSGRAPLRYTFTNGTTSTTKNTSANVVILP